MPLGTWLPQAYQSLTYLLPAIKLIDYQYLTGLACFSFAVVPNDIGSNPAWDGLTFISWRSHVMGFNLLTPPFPLMPDLARRGNRIKTQKSWLVEGFTMIIIKRISKNE